MIFGITKQDSKNIYYASYTGRVVSNDKLESWDF